MPTVSTQTESSIFTTKGRNNFFKNCMDQADGIPTYETTHEDPRKILYNRDLITRQQSCPGRAGFAFTSSGCEPSKRG